MGSPLLAEMRQCVPLALVLFVFWMILSSKRDGGHLAAGALCAMATALVTGQLLRLPPPVGRSSAHPLAGIYWHRFLTYLPWLGWQILRANLHVAAVVLNPTLPIAPRLVRVRMRAPHAHARLTLANSITLTPGTVTLDLEGDEFLVHALTETTARALDDGRMQRRVLALFDPRTGERRGGRDR